MGRFVTEPLMAHAKFQKKEPPMALTEAQIKEIFKRHDVNNDGLLSKDELRSAFKELGALFPGIRTYLGLRHADGNNDGYIDQDEMDKLVKYAYGLGYRIK